MRDRIEIIKLIVNYKIEPDELTLKNLITLAKNGTTNLKQIFNILVGCGLKIGKDEVYILLENGIPIKNLEMFDVEYDEIFYYHANKGGLSMEQYSSKLPADLKNKLILREMFRDSKWPAIEKFMKSNNLKPDGYCFKNSIDDVNILVLEYMMNEYGYKLSHEQLLYAFAKGVHWDTKRRNRIFALLLCECRDIKLSKEDLISSI